jgi:transposase
VDTMNKASSGIPGVIRNPDGSVLRRAWTKEQKRTIAEESFQPNTSVSIVARRHDVNTNQVFKWRQEYLRGEFNKPSKDSAPTNFIQLGIIGGDGPMATPPEKPASAQLPPPPVSQLTNSPQGIIEVVLRQGIRVRLKGNVDLSTLQHVIKTAAGLL